MSSSHSTLHLKWNGHISLLESQRSDHDHDIGEHTLAIIRKLSNRVHIALVTLDDRPPFIVAVKIATAAGDYKDLDHEWDLYSHELRPLQGVVVPKVFGLYKGTSRAMDLAVLVMEFCNSPPPGCNPVEDPKELDRLLMLAACKIHEAGVYHGDLSVCHYIQTGGYHGYKIVDFHKAVRHACSKGIPTLTAHRLGQNVDGCPELLDMEAKYGIRSGDTLFRRGNFFADYFPGLFHSRSLSKVIDDEEDI